MKKMKLGPIELLFNSCEEQIDSLKADLEKIKALRAINNKKELTKSDIQEAMSITCYGNLAGCCGPEKECPTQLAVCEALGIDPHALFDIKRARVNSWIEQLKT